MTIEQVFFATAGLMVTLFLSGLAFFKYYIDAKFDPLAKNIDLLIQYMVSHEGKISKIEGRMEEK